MPTKQRTYKIKSYVNASHAVRWATGSGKKHTHTWEIVCELHTVDAMVAFYDDEFTIEVQQMIKKKTHSLSPCKI
ncbi:6-pyruvoyl-tetrahydropterin synthase relatedprotein [Lactiplantibacillus plantarum]|nr:6-pyruvoyl-tetrahydropterin synthase relatedprotein [Lactiplantibacillus plantarum]